MPYSAIAAQPGTSDYRERPKTLPSTRAHTMVAARAHTTDICQNVATNSDLWPTNHGSPSPHFLAAGIDPATRPAWANYNPESPYLTGADTAP
jgi:hypothetical protein